MSLQLAVIFACTILIPFAIGLYYYRSLPTAVQIFFMLIAVGTVNEALMLSLTLLKIGNLFTLHIYTLLELAIISIFYSKLLSSRLTGIIASGALLLAVVGVGFAVYGENIYDFNSIPRALECVFVVSLSLRLFNETFNRDGDPAQDGTFYLNGGILFYFGSSLVIFAFSKYVLEADLLVLYSTHSFINAITNLIFALGLWISSRSYSTVQ
jgi:hypothetical protein